MRQSIFGDKNLDDFLSQYDEQVYINVLKLREILFTNLPRIIEQIDLPARMIAYCYGQKYGDMICTIIPSKRGVKLGFYKGVDLPDPDNLLKGTGKISRYIEIRSDNQINVIALKQLLEKALAAYRERIKNKKQN
ncbi:MAG: DUF1801 domain-containing protein [Chitinophagales bacterium]|nr:DUF1801 domain-containing protein [Chitinophagales bacterium]